MTNPFDPHGLTGLVRREGRLDFGVIACLPCNPDLVPDDMQIQAANIVSVEHRRIRCSNCNNECWIGKAQLAQLRDPRAIVVCYVCIAMDPELRHLGTTEPSFMLDPNANNVPRRSSSWLVTGE